jgi:hypothetical protein
METIGKGIKIKEIIFITNNINCQAIINWRIVFIFSQLFSFIPNNIKIDSIKKIPPNAQE